MSKSESQQREGLLGSDTREVEWQFMATALDPVETWIQQKCDDYGFTVEEAPPRDQTDTYFDTEEWAFYKADYCLRLRRLDDRCLATFKALSRSGALKSRREVTQPLDFPDPHHLGKTTGYASRWFVALSGNHTVHPLFKVRTLRRILILKKKNRPVAEIALDHSTILKDEVLDPVTFQMVELEGDEVATPAVKGFVKALRSECALEPAEHSKFVAGLMATRQVPPELPDIGPLGLEPGISIGDLAFVVLRRHFLALLQREPGTRLGEDIEELHQMRVSTRRLRAAILLFEDYLPASIRQLNKPLKWIADALGRVRDFDVKLEQLHAWLKEADEKDGVAFFKVIEIISRKRSRERKNMFRVLNSERYTRFVARFSKALKAGPGIRSRHRQRATDILPSLIRPLYEAVIQGGKKIKKSPIPDNYHDLRILCKKLRYGLEFVTDLCHKADKPVRKRLVDLQDLLGVYNDTTVAIAYINELIETEARRFPPHTVFTLGRMDERYRRKADDTLARYPKLYRKFKERSWKKLEASLRR